MTKTKLIHCITNPISINQCANAVLALGFRPIMAEHPKEVCEITQTADSVMLNTGNITDARMKSIRLSIKLAKDKDIPVVLDAVGAACSKLRRKFVKQLIRRYPPSLIKGNYSEIYSLFDEHYTAKGVDSDQALTQKDAEFAAEQLAKKYNCIVLASGKTDIVSDSESTLFVEGGTPMLSEITGTGCMLGAICACTLTCRKDKGAVVAACKLLKSCGEKAAGENFSAKLLDYLRKERELVDGL